MHQNTTDHIAKLAWNATIERWREFMVLPIVISLIFFGILSAFSYFTKLQNPYVATLGLVVLFVAHVVFLVTFYNALTKWCADLYGGKKVIDIEEGLRYGLSRFWGVVGTGLLTFLKILLWSLLLILPGLYKGLMYFHSIQVSQLEKISGGDANRISQKMISEAGFLRTLGNFSAIYMVTIIVFYFFFLLTFILGAGFAEAGQDTLSSLITGGLVGVGSTLMSIFLLVFFNYQYLVYRDENKATLSALVKSLKSMK